MIHVGLTMYGSWIHGCKFRCSYPKPSENAGWTWMVFGYGLDSLDQLSDTKTVGWNGFPSKHSIYTVCIGAWHEFHRIPRAKKRHRERHFPHRKLLQTSTINHQLPRRPPTPPTRVTGASFRSSSTANRPSTMRCSAIRSTDNCAPWGSGCAEPNHWWLMKSTNIPRQDDSVKHFGKVLKMHSLESRGKCLEGGAIT